MLERVIKEIDSLESEIKHLRNDIDPDEIAHWKAHPVTNLVRLEMLEEYVNQMEKSVGSVVTQQQVVEHAESRGFMKGLEMFLDWENSHEQDD